MSNLILTKEPANVSLVVIWLLTYEKLVKRRKIETGYHEMLDAHENMLHHLLDPIAKDVPITRLKWCWAHPRHRLKPVGGK